MKKQLLFILLLNGFYTLLTSCSSKDVSQHTLENIDTSKMVRIQMDPQEVMHKKQYKLVSSLFDSVRYLPLETTKESLIGSISQLATFEKEIFILDESTQAILIFNERGKFLRKIKNITTTSFTIDHKLRQILVRDNDALRTLVRYDIDGKLIRRQQMAIEFVDFESIDEKRTAYFRSYQFSQDERADLLPETERTSNLLIAQNNQFVSGFLQTDTSVINVKDFYLTQKSFYRNNGNIYFIRCYDYNVYKIIEDKINIAYRFEFPEKASLPDDFLYNADYKRQRKPYVEQHPDVFFFMSNFYEIKSSRFFTLYRGGKINSTLFWSDKNFKNILPFSNILSDSTSHYLSLGNSVHCSDEAALYTSLPSEDILRQRWNTKSKPQSPLSGPLADFFSNGTNRNNPVIVKLYPKTN